jgi:hypothetical protein
MVLHLVLNNEIVILKTSAGSTPAFTFCAQCCCLASLGGLGDKCNAVFAGIIWEGGVGKNRYNGKCFKLFLSNFPES